MYAMDVSHVLDVEKKDLLITRERQMIHIKKLKVKLEKVLI